MVGLPVGGETGTVTRPVPLTSTLRDMNANDFESPTNRMESPRVGCNAVSRTPMEQGLEAPDG